jgi:hypothetical protein
VKFPIGGKVRERKQNRFDSCTDSKVWMEEERIAFYAFFRANHAPKGAFFCPKKEKIR